MNIKKTVLVIAVLAAAVAFFALDLGRFLSLDYLKQSQAQFATLVQSQPLLVAGSYFSIYVAATALSLPGAAIITLAGGAIFGLGWGLLIVSFASSIGATLAFLVARFLLRDSIEARFGNRLAEINRGVEKDGAFYLFPSFDRWRAPLAKRGVHTSDDLVAYLLEHYQLAALPGTAFGAPAEQLSLRLATSYLDMETDDDAAAVLAAYRANPDPGTLMADHHPATQEALSRLSEFVRSL